MVKNSHRILSQYTYEQRENKRFDHMVRKEAELFNMLGTIYQNEKVKEYIEAMKIWIEYITRTERDIL